ncbi:spore germination protein KC [Caldicellulosiruptor bescii]|uniref:Germination protein, Ger(X)C family n=2 Tax=Caldicellulosiruptor bescii TaxID=31899 RepID=B9MQG2_CALBD|nr:Ger(x)C family spore germination protein [Caldicellulosiruptor bescii]ACM61819.1 germination protein, Ger(x)C family [Caldicellulosiruptor bescii DSM 6725]PBC88382.1 spore germination protein KC [Caldicellulosiruptor bescii]PBC92137.1 spore germination protein KC [Caldicellulosiruptor bescii]PBD05053.1 spore germination protein KC [Caldicellulosiruptor bescii]PBD05316.1 spore germination protein KC [Caldicellulosiruptor bescii]
MKKFVFYLTLILLTLAFLTGCWNRKELNDILIVQAVGIDKNQSGQFKLTYQVLKPKVLKTPTNIPSSFQQKGVWCFSSTGKSIFDAIRNTTLSSDKKLFFSHNKIIVISEKVAHQGIENVLDIFLRYHEFRPDAYLIVTSDDIEKFLNSNVPIESIPAKELENVIKNYFANSKTLPISIYEFQKMSNTKSKTAPVPFVTIKSPLKQSSQSQMFYVEKMAVFSNYKLVGYLTHEELRGLLWAAGKIKRGIYPIKLGKDIFSLELIQSRSNINVKRKLGKAFFILQITTETNLGEKYSNSYISSSLVEKTKKEFSKSIRNDVQKVLKKSFELNCDILHLGDIYYSSYKKPLNFDKNSISVSIVVKPFIRRFGMMKE